MLSALARMIKVLNSQSEPGQVSLAFAFSMAAGFTPLFSLPNLAAVALVLILKVNLSAFFLGFVFFSALAFLLDPLFGWVGVQVLTAEGLTEFWTALYNAPGGRLSKFYNSIVMGSFLISVLLFLPVHYGSKALISRYRKHVLRWVRKTRLAQVLQTTRFYRVYSSLSTLRGSE